VGAIENNAAVAGSMGPVGFFRPCICDRCKLVVSPAR
jgi:hypothetical protein